MPLRKLFLKDFTAFDELELEFSPGLNIFIGLNGTGKTHVMKVLYSQVVEKVCNRGVSISILFA